MILRDRARFGSTLPEDEIEDENGDFIQYGGKSVALAITEILGSLGCNIEGPAHAYEHGWDFVANYERKYFIGQITLIDEYYFVFKNPYLLERVLGRPSRVYVDLLQALARALQVDPRFSNVRWFSQAELDSGFEGVPLPAAEQGRSGRR
jgi:hypothetical protein